MKVLLLLSFFVLITATAQVPISPSDIAPLLISEKIPDTKVVFMDGVETTTEKVFSRKKTILLFYRGGWCPYCNTHLSAVGEVSKQINEMGYQIIGLSPDANKNLIKTKDKVGLDYDLIGDGQGVLMKTMGIAFQAPKQYGSMLLKHSGDLNQEKIIPVPSMFIVDTDGTILFEYISPDYKNRISADLLLHVLKNFD